MEYINNHDDYGIYQQYNHGIYQQYGIRNGNHGIYQQYNRFHAIMEYIPIDEYGLLYPNRWVYPIYQCFFNTHLLGY